ncbi:MAG: hypothetical protein ACK4N5_24325, partial [Myxococcales bacterium]
MPYALLLCTLAAASDGLVYELQLRDGKPAVLEGSLALGGGFEPPLVVTDGAGAAAAIGPLRVVTPRGVRRVQPDVRGQWWIPADATQVRWRMPLPAARNPFATALRRGRTLQLAVDRVLVRPAELDADAEVRVNVVAPAGLRVVTAWAPLAAGGFRT